MYTYTHLHACTYIEQMQTDVSRLDTAGDSDTTGSVASRDIIFQNVNSS